MFCYIFHIRSNIGQEIFLEHTGNTRTYNLITLKYVGLVDFRCSNVRFLPWHICYAGHYQCLFHNISLLRKLAGISDGKPFSSCFGAQKQCPVTHGLSIARNGVGGRWALG